MSGPEIEAFGEKKSASAWARDPRCVVGRKGLVRRLESGWSCEEALTTPPKTVGRRGAKNRLVEAFGEKKSVLAWSKDERCLVSRTMLRKRLAQGIDLELALTTPPTKSPDFSLKEAFGERKSLADWVRDQRCVATYECVISRMAEGWGLEEALTRYPRGSGPIESWGMSKTAAEWAEDWRSHWSLTSRNICRRVGAGWEPKRALTEPLNEADTFEAFGEEKTLYQWSRDDRCAVSLDTLRARAPEAEDFEIALTVPVEPPLELQAWGERKTVAEWTADPRCGVDFPATIYTRIKTYGMTTEESISLPPMRPTSKAEDEIEEFLRGFSVSVERNTREPLNREFEIDVYVPSHRLGIEHNGLYWHSEVHKPRSYHADKRRAAEREGIQLLQIWEDDWRDRRPIVEAMICHKLGLATGKVMARKCAVEQIPYREAAGFLERHHLQGGVGHSVAVGLRHEGELVAVCTFKRKPGDGAWELKRYATSKSVVGGFTRCLRHFQRTQEWSEITTFADLMISDGSLYEVAGFVEHSRLRPDYYYVAGDHRFYKSSYRLKRFRKDPSLQWVEGLTERELAELNGLHRAWDAGKIRYVMASED